MVRETRKRVIRCCESCVSGGSTESQGSTEEQEFGKSSGHMLISIILVLMLNYVQFIKSL